MTKVTKEVVVVGAGCVFQLLMLGKPGTEDRLVGRISGLVTGIQLKEKLAVENFTVCFFLSTVYFSVTNQRKLQIYEREEQVGGTWRVSSYYYLVILSRTTNTARPAAEQVNTYPVRTQFLLGFNGALNSSSQLILILTLIPFTGLCL